MEPGDHQAVPERARILIVDDNPLNALLCRTLLAGEPCEVAVAGDARHALDTMATFSPDLILMDLELPDVDGLTLARQILAQRPVRIVALTAHRAEDVADAVDAAGCLGLITKPLEPEAFLGAVRAYLATPGAPRA